MQAPVKKPVYHFKRQDTYLLPLCQTPEFLLFLGNTSRIHLFLHQFSIDQSRTYSAVYDMHPQSGEE
jgi:hypothetical protein